MMFFKLTSLFGVLLSVIGAEFIPGTPMQPVGGTIQMVQIQPVPISLHPAIVQSHMDHHLEMRESHMAQILKKMTKQMNELIDAISSNKQMTSSTSSPSTEPNNVSNMPGNSTETSVPNANKETNNKTEKNDKQVAENKEKKVVKPKPATEWAKPVPRFTITHDNGAPLYHIY
ncbi:uncharacterized protein LOC129577917 [Sitodiplosis mosellana]|uniref:uncharacterized protein LOC129577917 n=1 Tax=Sitodiplosis mosellana TaxID=263140 RepID=UPI0024437B70|nr:uncharacterized protein LOC129577917 [Sitodiplosis mosellana]